MARVLGRVKDIDTNGNAGGPSALIAYSANDSDILWMSGIAGAFVEVKRPRSIGKGVKYYKSQKLR